MVGLPSLQVGSAVAVSRLALERRSPVDQRPFQWESQRRERVSTALCELHQRRGSPDIHLQRGELRTAFDGSEDTRRQNLYSLAQTMGHEWEGL